MKRRRARPGPRIREARAALPEAYQNAKRALRLCARDFTPANFAAATDAMHRLDETDPTDAITDPREALDACCAIANDNELERLARKVAAEHRRWKETNP